MARISCDALAEIDRLARQLGPLYGPLAVFAAETGMRPSERCALERRGVLRAEGVVTVARTFSRGVLKGYGKTSRSRRRVPLSARAREWMPALDAAGLPRRRIYDLRHIAISHWLAAGL